MRAKLRTRIERLESRIIPESDGKLPLEYLRHCINGTVSPWEAKRWGPLAARIVAEANARIEQENARDLAAGLIPVLPNGLK